MSVWAVSMMKDEADVAFHVVRHMFDQDVDGVLVADNGSHDDTAKLLHEAGAFVMDDPVPAYYQAEKMTRLARRAAEEYGAEWIVPFDADELWTVSRLNETYHSTVADELRCVDADVVRVPAYDYLPRRDDPDEPNPFKRLRWRRDHTQTFPKVAFRWNPDAELAMGNHSVHWPGARVVPGCHIRHYQYRSFEQLVRKVRQGAEAYRQTNLPETEVAHWKQLAVLSDDLLRAEWELLLDEEGLVLDP